MMRKDVVSVIVPIYNVEKFLCECIDSVIAQTYEKWELILVDDESTDGSLRICQQYEKDDDRITCVRAAHLGACYARNMGLDAATGEFVFFLDADDYLAENILEVLVNKMKGNQVAMVCAECQSVMENGKAYPYRRPAFPEETVSCQRMLRDVLTYNTLCSIWGKLYRREFVGESRFMRCLALGEDIAFLCTLLYGKLDMSVLRMSTPLYYYRILKNSVSHSRDSSRQIEKVKTYMCFMQSFAAEHGVFMEHFSGEFSYNMLRQVIHTFELQGTAKRVSAWHYAELAKCLPSCEGMDEARERLGKRILSMPEWKADAYLTVHYLPAAFKNWLRVMRDYIYKRIG